MKGLVRFVSLLDDGTPEDVSFPPGVLPLPKPDENQTDFISVGDVYQMPFFALPVTNPEPSAVRRLLEAMAADGEACADAYRAKLRETRVCLRLRSPVAYMTSAPSARQTKTASVLGNFISA